MEDNGGVYIFGEFYSDGNDVYIVNLIIFGEIDVLDGAVVHGSDVNISTRL